MQTLIQNTTPRRDVDGRIIDCHDGCLRHFDGRFYLYGTRYGETDGFTRANRFVCYSSPDLEQWTAEGELLREPMDGVCYRPYVVYNPGTRRYVLWFNWYPVLWEGQFAVGMSESPAGPFEVVEADAAVVQPRPGDHNVFVDDDGTGYLIYTSIQGDPAHGIPRHGMSVEQLNDAFIGTTGRNSGFLDHSVEAPAMIKHAGRYLCVFGRTCCFGPEGADARVYRAEHPLGPWEFATQINGPGDGPIGEDGPVTIEGQQTDIATIPTAAGPLHIWMADLWGSRPDGVKGHDLQHWEPLRFGDDGLPRALENLASWSTSPAAATSTAAQVIRR